MKRLTLMLGFGWIIGILLALVTALAQEVTPVAMAIGAAEFVPPAQEATPEGVGATSNPDPVNWLMYVALAINAALVPLGADLLKRVWADMPSALKTLLPLVAGSLITAAQGYLLSVFGVPIDLSLIEQILLGGGVAGLGATLAFKKGEAHGASG